MNDQHRQRILHDWLQLHRSLILKVVRAFAFDAHDREDLFQEIAVQLWDSVPRYKQESAVTTWIYRVALYSGIAWSKRERRHSDRSQELEQAPV